VDVQGENTEEAPYVTMTRKLIEKFPKAGGRFRIEPDASSGSYFLAAETLGPVLDCADYSAEFGVNVPTRLLSNVAVANWPCSGWQIDERFVDLNLTELHCFDRDRVLEEMTSQPHAGQAPSVISRVRDLGDSIMTAMVLAPFAFSPVRFTDLGRLRVQECERVVALRTELTKCGAKVDESGDTLEVFPSDLHGAEIETYNDHRMAMCFAVLGLKVPGIKIKNPSCVKKTFPNFFQKLAASPPKGLGATIRDAQTGRVLVPEDLFAA
jgi:3-phosphoshikimate 1-carboxyvinyltransferase